MNLNDILIPPGPNEPSFEYSPSANCFPPRKIVICQDKILRYCKDEKPQINANFDSQIGQDNEQQNEDDLSICQMQADEKLAENNCSSKNHRYPKRSYKTNQISKISIEERKRVKKRIANFDRKNSQAWKFLSLVYGPQIKQDKLISIAEYVASHLKIYIDRDARRRKSVLIKWFDENWNRIGPFFKLY